MHAIFNLHRECLYAGTTCVPAGMICVPAGMTCVPAGMISIPAGKMYGINYNEAWKRSQFIIPDYFYLCAIFNLHR